MKQSQSTLESKEEKPLTVVLPRDFIKKLKIMSINKNLKMKDMIRIAIDNYWFQGK